MKRAMLGLAAGLFLVPVVAMADSLTPSSYSANIATVGGSVTFTKMLTVTKEAGTSAPVDVFFMADTTGSMGSYITTVRNGAAAIMTATAGLGDVNYAVGEYKDVGDVFVYRKNQDVTSSTAAVQAGINAWGASGGGDYPEGNLYALEQAANTTAWRAGSTRIMVWFGDAPGHDPRNGSTEASATAALVAKNITVEALNNSGLNDYGQAVRIAAATGGTYYPTVNTASIVAVITDAIKNVVDTYTTVALDLSEVPAGLDAVVNPVSYVGDFTRAVDRTFEFEVTLTALAAGTYDFNIYGLVDKGRVATEKDRITVGDAVPEPTTMLLFGAGLLGLASLGRRRGNLK